MRATKLVEANHYEMEKGNTIMSNTMYLVTGAAGIIVTVSPDYNPVVMNVNVVGTKNIIRCCLTHPECKKLVYCSSTGAIPEVTQTVLDAVKLENLNACVVHPSGILGPEDFAVGETTKTVICLSDKK